MIRRLLRFTLRAGLILGAGYMLVGYLMTRLSAEVGFISEREVIRAPLDRIDSLFPVTALGAVSVHSGRSHDAVGTFDEVGRAATTTGLDFVVLGDHPGDWVEADNPLRPRRAQGALLIPGLELVVADRGRVLVFGVDTLPQRWEGTLTELVQEVDPVDGFISVVHPRSPRTREMWKSQVAEGVHAWESMDVSEMARARLAEPLGAFYVANFLVALPTGRGDRTVTRLWRERASTPAILAFDSIRSSVPTVLTGGLNHHPKTRIAGKLFPAYEPFFRSVVNHLMLEGPLADDPIVARRQVAAALREGRLFVTLGNAPEAEGFRSWVEHDDGTVVRSGEQAEWRPGNRLMVRIPEGAPGRTLVRVIQNGRATGYFPADPGEGLSITLPQPGIYRVEVHHAGRSVLGRRFNQRPWIFANPIELTTPIEEAIPASPPDSLQGSSEA